MVYKSVQIKSKGSILVQQYMLKENLKVLLRRHTISCINVSITSSFKNYCLFFKLLCFQTFRPSSQERKTSKVFRSHTIPFQIKTNCLCFKLGSETSHAAHNICL